MPRDLTVIDAGLGNLASVERALNQVGAAVHLTSDPDEIRAARALVFPGQGAFGEGTDDLISGAQGEAIREVIDRGDPFLGICMGMQLLFETSEEGGGKKGLGILKGRCRRFPEMHAGEGENRRTLKIPHCGWNEVDPAGDHYYFLHSYYCIADDPSDVMWTTTYGDVTFAAAVRRDNIIGCQFHPEKSQHAGLRFLRAFILGGGGS
jgi:glutamine amidotransferase